MVWEVFDCEFVLLLVVVVFVVVVVVVLLLLLLLVGTHLFFSFLISKVCQSEE